MLEGERRLAAIMFTDIVGYTALTQKDERLALEVLGEHNRLLRGFFPLYHGKEVKAIGDSFLVEFDSALDAANCAVEIQRSLREYNESAAEERRIILRIGIHLGDVVHSQDDVFGDAVNIASRIQPLAEPEGVCVSQQVYDQVRNKLPFQMVRLPSKQLKNVIEPVDVYRIDMAWEVRRTNAEYDVTRLAILPFANYSPDPGDEYFADGITEEVISTVSGISGLSVISRTSVMGYKGTTKKVREIGEELGVGSVLEGSLRKAGDKVRITTQLIQVSDDRHVWSQSYDRRLDDVFAVQSDIAKQVANSLRVKILPREETRLAKPPTSSAEAHSLYLKGRHLWNTRTEKGLTEAIELFKRASEIDPEYALAYSGVADCYNVLADHEYIPFAKAYAEAKKFALKAVELDPDSAEAHASLGAASWSPDRDWTLTESEFKKAIALNPNYATARHWHAIFLQRTGHLDESLKEAKAAEELDPLSPQIATFLGVAYDASGQYDLAMRQFARALELQPDFLPAVGNMVEVCIHQGRFDEAIKFVKEHYRISGFELGYKLYSAAVLAQAGKTEEAARFFEEAKAMSGFGKGLFEAIIMYYVATGKKEEAVRTVERAYEAGADWLGTISFEPAFKDLREDPRVQAVLRKVGVR